MKTSSSCRQQCGYISQTSCVIGKRKRKRDSRPVTLKNRQRTGLFRDAEEGTQRATDGYCKIRSVVPSESKLRIHRVLLGPGKVLDLGRKRSWILCALGDSAASPSIGET